MKPFIPQNVKKAYDVPGMDKAWGTVGMRVGKALLTVQGPEDLEPDW